MSHKLKIKQVDLSAVTNDNSLTKYLVLGSSGDIYYNDSPLAGSTGTSGGSITSGSSGYVPRYTGTSGTSALIESSIYDDPAGNFTGVGITAPYDPLNPERFFVSAGTSGSYNLISGHSNLDSYVQLNIQNFNSGQSASSDVVATSDIGDETVGYIDMGINSSGYSEPDAVGTAGDAYLYSTGEDLLIGNATAGKE